MDKKIINLKLNNTKIILKTINMSDLYIDKVFKPILKNLVYHFNSNFNINIDLIDVDTYWLNDKPSIFFEFKCSNKLITSKDLMLFFIENFSNDEKSKMEMLGFVDVYNKKYQFNGDMFDLTPGNFLESNIDVTILQTTLNQCLMNFQTQMKEYFEDCYEKFEEMLNNNEL